MLEDLVTDILMPDYKEEEPSPLEYYTASPSIIRAISVGETLLQSGATDPAKGASFAALFIRANPAYPIHSRHHRERNRDIGIEFLLSLYEGNDLEAKIEEMIYLLRLAEILNDQEKKFSFLEERIDNFHDTLQDMTGVSQSSIKRWLSGDRPNASAGAIISCLVEVFYHLQGLGMSKSEAWKWVSEHEIVQKSPSGQEINRKTTIDYIKYSTHRSKRLPVPVVRQLQEMGTKLFFSF